MQTGLLELSHACKCRNPLMQTGLLELIAKVSTGRLSQSAQPWGRASGSAILSLEI